VVQPSKLISRHRGRKAPPPFHLPVFCFLCIHRRAVAHISLSPFVPCHCFGRVLAPPLPSFLFLSPRPSYQCRGHRRKQPNNPHRRVGAQIWWKRPPRPPRTPTSSSTPESRRLSASATSVPPFHRTAGARAHGGRSPTSCATSRLWPPLPSRRRRWTAGRCGRSTGRRRAQCSGPSSS
jgi:hypothetical protein